MVRDRLGGAHLEVAAASRARAGYTGEGGRKLIEHAAREAVFLALVARWIPATRDGDTWKLARVISYDHQLAGEVP